MPKRRTGLAAATDDFVKRYGIRGKQLEELQRLIRLAKGPSRQGRPSLDVTDAAYIRAAVELLAKAAQEGIPMDLGEAVRQVFEPDKPSESERKRLVRKIPFCWDIPGRGWGQAKWKPADEEDQEE